MMTNTPESWHVETDERRYHQHAIMCGDREIGMVNGVNKDAYELAALIAAAPDLLAACEAFVSNLVKTKEIVEQARAAIAKATS